MPEDINHHDKLMLANFPITETILESHRLREFVYHGDTGWCQVDRGRKRQFPNGIVIGVVRSLTNNAVEIL